jgi:hypothetical protein|tara:strand:- start:185 stop:547 length:363 start_codon:yes stop_codon:yes gene_type:complete
MKKICLFNDVKYRRPSLCAYCHGLASALLYIDNEKIKGACSMEHLKYIGEGKRMEHIQNFAQINEELLSVALSDAKSKYIELSKKNGSYVLHQWDKEDRVSFVKKLVSSYLVNSKAQADE